MSFIFIITLIVIGAVAASDYLTDKIPQTKNLLDYIKPHSNWVGLVSFILGIFWLLRVLFSLGTMLRYYPIHTLIMIAALLLMIVLGLIMAQPYIKPYASKNKSISNFNDSLINKYSPIKEKLGQSAIVIGLLNLILQIT
jgi:amino acid transporter